MYGFTSLKVLKFTSEYSFELLVSDIIHQHNGCGSICTIIMLSWTCYHRVIMDVLSSCYHGTCSHHVIMDVLSSCYHGRAIIMLSWTCCHHLSWTCYHHVIMDMLYNFFSLVVLIKGTIY